MADLSTLVQLKACMTERFNITIYSDGGASPNPGPGGWAALLIADNGYTKELSGAEKETTNNRMELTAAVEALRALKQSSHVMFYTDSEYLRKGITEWLAKWIRQGWQRREGEVKNQDLWQALQAETKRHEITWQWVKGHAGNPNNERVDQMATAARQQMLGLPVTPIPTAQVEIAFQVRASKTGKYGGWAIRVTAQDAAPEIITNQIAGENLTHNELELIALLDILQRATPDTALNIYCPSDYTCNGMSQWVHGWQKRGWITKEGGEVQHRKRWEALLDAARPLTIRWLRDPNPPPDYVKQLKKLAAHAAGEST